MDYQNKYEILIQHDHPCFKQIAQMLEDYDNNKKEVVAFIGRAGSGKDYQCQLLTEQGYKKVAFADALRDIAFQCIDLDEQEGMIFYDYLKANDCIEVRLPDDYRRFNFRHFLEVLGTQGIRNYDDNFWCRCLIKTLDESIAKYNKFCISDMRFINEYNFLKDWCSKNNFNFRVIFCNYRSDRYQDNNKHASAKMGNYFAEHGYKDLAEISDIDMQQYQYYLNTVQ